MPGYRTYEGQCEGLSTALGVTSTLVAQDSNRFFEPAPGTIAADLVDLGVSIAEADRLDAFTRTFVGSNPMQVTPQDQAAFASLLDPERPVTLASRWWEAQ